MKEILPDRLTPTRFHCDVQGLSDSMHMFTADNDMLGCQSEHTCTYVTHQYSSISTVQEVRYNPLRNKRLSSGGWSLRREREREGKREG